MSRRIALICALPLWATAMVVLFSYGAPWRGEWNWTIDTITGTTTLTGPLIGSCAAWVARELRSLDVVTRTTPRGWLAPIRAAVETAAVGTSTLAMVAGIGLGVTAIAQPGGPAQLWTLLMGPVVLLTCCALGAAAGWLAPHRLTVIAVAPAIYLVGAFAPGPIAALFTPGLSTGSLAGLRYDLEYWLAQVGVLVAIVALVWGFLARFRPAGWALLTGAVLLFAALVTGLVASEPDPFEVSDERPTLCAGQQPQFCMAPSHRSSQERMGKRVGEAAAVFRQAKIALPARYDESLPGYDPPSTRGLLGDYQRKEGGIRGSARLLVTPAGCAAWTADTPPPFVVGDAQDLIVEWAVLRAGKKPRPWDPDSQRFLTQTDERSQRAWVAQTFAQLRACTLNDIALPKTPRR